MLAKRERILQYFETVLSAVTGVNFVQRTLVDPNTREDCPFISIDWTSENATPQTVPQAERTLSIEVSMFWRGDIPDTPLNDIATRVHAAIMADSSLGGLAIDTAFGDATFQAESADQSAGKLTHEYRVMYRHSYGDMTQ